MFDKVADDFLPTIVFDRFVTNQMLKQICSALFSDNDIIIFDENSGNITFPSGEVGILSVDLNNTNLDDVNFYEDDPHPINHVGLLVWHNKT